MSATAATFVFADIAGFTALTEAHGDEEAVALVGEFSDAVEAELPAVSGEHVKTIGDALMLRIPVPGDAIGLGLRIANDLMTDHGAPAVRVGLHHGPAVERKGDYFGRASTSPPACRRWRAAARFCSPDRRRPWRPTSRASSMSLAADGP